MPATPSLSVQEPNGTYRPATPTEIRTAALSALHSRFAPGAILGTPETVSEYLQLNLAHHEHEVFAILWLDNRHRVIAFEELFRGTIDGASVHPREVVKSALHHNAAACIFAHNHPSGTCDPSQADIRITKRLQSALALVDVRVLDHFIVGLGYCSLAERGLLPSGNEA